MVGTSNDPHWRDGSAMGVGQIMLCDVLCGKAFDMGQSSLGSRRKASVRTKSAELEGKLTLIAGKTKCLVHPLLASDSVRALLKALPSRRGLALLKAAPAPFARIWRQNHCIALVKAAGQCEQWQCAYAVVVEGVDPKGTKKKDLVQIVDIFIRIGCRAWRNARSNFSATSSWSL